MCQIYCQFFKNQYSTICDKRISSQGSFANVEVKYQKIVINYLFFIKITFRHMTFNTQTHLSNVIHFFKFSNSKQTMCYKNILY